MGVQTNLINKTKPFATLSLLSSSPVVVGSVCQLPLEWLGWCQREMIRTVHRLRSGESGLGEGKILIALIFEGLVVGQGFFNMMGRLWTDVGPREDVA